MHFKIKQGSYKSIEAPFEWTDIPKFALITGENGTGKSQLLELLNLHFDPNKSKKISQYPGLNFIIEDAPYQHHEVLYLANFSTPEASGQIGLNEVSSSFQSVLTTIRNNKNPGNPFETYRVSRTKAFLNEKGIDVNKSSDTEIFQVLPQDIFYSKPNQLLQSVSLHFFNYHLETIWLKSKGKTDEQIIETLGQPPWEILSDLINKSNLFYEISTPSELDLRAKYHLLLIDKVTKKKINPNSLSTGEIALLRLYLWLFVSRGKYTFPKLLILDEPDAHLHPFLIFNFVNALKEGLIDTNQCRVIMTTHRPETIMSVPDESIFEMFSRPARINLAHKKSHAVSLITKNLYHVVENKYPIYVEDNDDVSFYSAVLDVIKTDYPGRINAQAIFIPARISNKKETNPGGKSAVKTWVERLRATGLVNIVKGVIDKDTSNQNGDGLHVIKRYAIENYMLDPIVIFGLLMDFNQQPTLELSREIKLGEECFIRDLPNEDLFIIASTILNDMRIAVSGSIDVSNEAMIKCQYLNGKEIEIPNWLIEARGHTLFNLCKSKWPRLSYDMAIKSINKIRLVPIDLYDLLDELLK